MRHILCFSFLNTNKHKAWRSPPPFLLSHYFLGFRRTPSLKLKDFDFSDPPGRLPRHWSIMLLLGTISCPPRTVSLHWSLHWPLCRWLSHTQSWKLMWRFPPPPLRYWARGNNSDSTFKWSNKSPFEFMKFSNTELIWTETACDNCMRLSHQAIWMWFSSVGARRGPRSRDTQTGSKKTVAHRLSQLDYI